MGYSIVELQNHWKEGPETAPVGILWDPVGSHLGTL